MLLSNWGRKFGPAQDVPSSEGRNWARGTHILKANFWNILNEQDISLGWVERHDERWKDDDRWYESGKWRWDDDMWWDENHVFETSKERRTKPELPSIRKLSLNSQRANYGREELNQSNTWTQIIHQLFLLYVFHSSPTSYIQSPSQAQKASSYPMAI